MNKITTIKLFLCVLASLQAGCANRSGIPEVSLGDFHQQLTVTVYKDRYWPVYTWSQVMPVTDTLRIYIEGDGRAWLSSSRPSLDPTPVNRLVHQLMLKDPSPDLAYLAQPCQYRMNDNCNRNVWTFERYSPKVVATMDSAVTQIKEKGGYRSLELVGYSGGGAIALLLTAKRDDVISVRTVAGNLSPRFLNQYHGVSEIPAAMDPVSFEERLSTAPQIHFAGTRDRTVPLEVIQHYVNSFADGACIKIREVNADHQAGWIQIWPSLLERPPECGH